MPFERDPLRIKALCEAFDQVDRTVLTPGASNGHRYVAAVVARKRIEPVFQKMSNVVQHQIDVGLCLQELCYGLIPSG